MDDAEEPAELTEVAGFDSRITVTEMKEQSNFMDAANTTMATRQDERSSHFPGGPIMNQSIDERFSIMANRMSLNPLTQSFQRASLLPKPAKKQQPQSKEAYMQDPSLITVIYP